MNNTITTAVGAVALFLLDEINISPWVAAPVALAIGFAVAWHITRHRAHER